MNKQEDIKVRLCMLKVLDGQHLGNLCSEEKCKRWNKETKDCNLNTNK